MVAVLSCVEAAPVDVRMVSLQLEKTYDEKGLIVGRDYTGEAHQLAINDAKRDGLLQRISLE